MKKILLGSLVLCVVALPSVSHAQVGFGSPLDAFRFPITCSIPPFVPSCNLVDEAGDFISLPTDIVENFFDLFILLQIEGFSLSSGFLAIPMWLTLSPTISPSPVLAPGFQTLGTLILGGPVGGMYVKPFIWTIPPQYPCGPPPVVTIAPGLCCLPSMCIPMVTPIGTVTSYTGAAPSAFGNI